MGAIKMEINRHVLWIWLKEILSFNNKKVLKLVDYYGTVEELYQNEDFSACRFLNEKELRALRRKDLRNAWEVYGDCCENQIGILTPEDALYPELLREIDNPPAPLFFKGHLTTCLQKPTITIVGTRKANGYSEEVTKDITLPLCHCGFTVVCGVAEGIDTFALESAIRADSGPIAVLPYGILSNHGASTKYFKDILRYGALVSEYFPRTKTQRFSYHERNRILSGLSLGTLIIQAPKRSGALMTANYATEQDRDLFAVMANASPETEGSNNLIKDGCFPVTSYTDILHVYLPQFKDQLKELTGKPEHVYSLQEELTENKLIAYRKKHSKQLSESECTVFNLITTEETTTDDLIEQTNLPVSEILQILTMLEFKGLIVSCPGSKFKVIL